MVHFKYSASTHTSIEYFDTEYEYECDYEWFQWCEHEYQYWN